MKCCSNCGVEKSELQFHWRNKKRNWRSSWCKTCVSNKTKKRYKENPEYFRQKNRNRRKRMRNWLNTQKKNPCMDCGGTFPTVCMDFDHVNGEKMGNLSVMAQAVSLQKLKEEIAKCELVCANCHRIRTFN